jgi:hypothetical protein
MNDSSKQERNMAKLVSIESGFIVPLPGISDPSFGSIFIDDKTKLIIDGDDKQKHFEQKYEAEEQAQKGFEVFGKFFTSFWH